MITIGIPILNQAEAAQKTLESLKRLQKHDNRYIIVDNGSEPKVRDWLIGLTDGDEVIRNPKNKGLPKALNQILRVNKSDYVFMTHTDIEMFEQDWDQRVMDAINQAGNVGVAGFYGALGIGTFDIYKTPYMFQQLARTNPLAGDRCKLDPRLHGHYMFGELWKKCAVLDGFSLIVKKSMWFDTRFGPHHMYDNDVCLESIKKGYQNIVINMDVNHYGGKTDVGEDWATPFGKTKQQVHQEAHPPFYEKYRGFLPYRV